MIQVLEYLYNNGEFELLKKFFDDLNIMLTDDESDVDLIDLNLTKSEERTLFIIRLNVEKKYKEMKYER